MTENLTQIRVYTRIKHDINSSSTVLSTSRQTQFKMNALYDTLPTDLQEKIYKKIVYPQPDNLMFEIKTTKFSKHFYDVLKLFVKNPKKISGLKDSLRIMSLNGGEKQAEIFKANYTKNYRETRSKVRIKKCMY